jgi:hypothetical protein
VASDRTENVRLDVDASVAVVGPSRSVSRPLLDGCAHTSACVRSSAHERPDDQRNDGSNEGARAMKTYRSFEEFTREEIRPASRIGFSLDELDIDNDYFEELSFSDGEEGWQDEDEE